MTDSKSKMKIKNDFIINKKLNKMSELYPEIEVEFDSDCEEKYPTAGIKLPKDFSLKNVINECIAESDIQKNLDEEFIENPEEGLKLMKERDERKKANRKEVRTNYFEKLKSDTERYEEHKAKQREYQKQRYAKLKEEGKMEKINESRKKRYHEKKGDEEFEKKRTEAREKYKEKRGTIKCECGVEYQNLKHKKERHLNSDKHKMWVLRNSPDFKQEDTIPEDVKDYLSKACRRSKKEIEEMAKKNGGMRGTYHCLTCDINIHFTKTDLMKHFNSNQHLKNYVKCKSASN